jgi:hypothetical protein
VAVILQGIIVGVLGMKNGLARIMTVSLILAISLISMTCGSSPALAHNEQAVVLLKGEKYKEALVEVNKAIELPAEFYERLLQSGFDILAVG